jgi:hypothetical protein
MTLASLPLARLLRSRRSWLLIVLWAVLALGAAAMGRMHATAHGADHVLLGAYGAIALPLLVYGVVSTALGNEGLARSGVSLVALGAAPSRVARATWLVTVGAGAILGGLLGAGVAALGHGASDPPLAVDAARSLEIGALGGAAYASFFLLGASFGARGLGRSILLVVDWVLGVGKGSGAMLVPRSHLHNLLGGGSRLDLSQRASFIALAFLTLACGVLAVSRATRTEWRLLRP